MTRLLLAACAALAIVTPVLAQDAAKPAAPALPANTFFKGQTSAQILGKESLIGAKVAGKDNAALGTVDDVIVSGSQLEGLIIAAGDKKVGVRIGAVKMTTTDGKLSIAVPAVTPDMLKSVGAYQRAHNAAKK
jgi:hypothetical protein